MKYEHWQIPAAPEDAIKTLMDAGYPYLVSSVLAARGVTTSEQAAEALEREKTLAHSPFLMKDMDKAVARISKALENGEKLAVFGDYDVDGITSTCLLTDYLRSRGADVTMHIPRRIEEGYGLGCDAIRALSESGVTLIVTVDCGITGVDETAYAATLGVDLVITDHHECKEQLPAAVAVVDPHRPDCPYPFKHLAGVGVALKLVLALGEGREDALFARYCTLAAIGTIADVMRMEGENRTIVQCGLESIDRSDFTGLHALLREAGLTSRPISSIQIGFVLAPRINAAGRMGRAELAAELLLTDDPVRAEKLARELCELNRERQSVEQDIFRRAIEQMEDLPESERSALVLSSEDWHQGVVGIVASRLSEKFSCPSFMIHLSGGSGKGSCRSYGGFNLFDALSACSEYLEGFGGHALAAGLNIKRDKLRQFCRAFSEYYENNKPTELPTLCCDICVTDPGILDMKGVDALSRLEPYGSGNPKPTMCILGARLDKVTPIGGGKHLRLSVGYKGAELECVFFSHSEADLGLKAGDKVDIAFTPQINEFRLRRSVQLQITAMRLHDPKPLCGMILEDELPVTEASSYCPDRSAFVKAWRRLQALGGSVAADLDGVIRQCPHGIEPERFCICLMVLCELGLLKTVKPGSVFGAKMVSGSAKVNLESSELIKRLKARRS